MGPEEARDTNYWEAATEKLTFSPGIGWRCLCEVPPTFVHRTSRLLLSHEVVKGHQRATQAIEPKGPRKPRQCRCQKKM